MASLSLAFDLLVRDNGANRDLRRIGDTAEDTGRRGERAGAALGNGLKFGALAAAAGLVALAGASTKFITEAAESARIGRLTEAVVKSTGGVANVTAAQVDKLSTALSNKSAVDDELIANAANVLLTFTNVRNEVGEGNNIFDRATEAALNMSAALGTDLQGATLSLGKALNDPTAGITKLSRAGVQFTEQQKEQIKTLQESGDILGAQGIILDELGVQFGGAAEAAASPLERLKVVAGNLGEQIGTVLLPYVERFATFASDVLIPALATFITQFENGEGAGGRLAAVIDTVRTAVSGLVFGFTEGDVASDGLAGKFELVGAKARQIAEFLRDEVLPRLVQFAGFVRDEVVPRVADLVAKIRDDVLPRLREFGDFLQTKVFPGLKIVAEYLRETFQPTADALVTLFRENLVPAFQRVKEIVDENRPALEKLATVIGTVATVYGFVYTQIAGFLLPILIKLVGYLIDGVIFAFNNVVTTTGFVIDKIKILYENFQTARENVEDFVTKIGEIKVPGPLEDIADLIATIGRDIGGVASGVAGFVSDRVGDVAGAFRGTAIGGAAPLGATSDAGGQPFSLARQAQGYSGTALARINQLIGGSGLSITSTYRSPSRNAAVGGSPTSLHMDSNNPAVDIAGPVGAMDRFAAQLAAIGGWRQLAYRVPGHYDHIHVAHSGGIVDSSWPRSPGDGPNERTIRAQVGEGITPVSQMGKSGTITVGTIVAADPREAMRAMWTELKIQQSVDATRAGVFA